jgi:hypothetical protein
MYYKIEYYSTKEIGGIPANTHFWFWLDAAFANPEESIFEEGLEDGQKAFTPTFQKSTKTYTLQTNLIYENLVDAINWMKYFNVKTITMPDGTAYTMNNVKTEIEDPFGDGCSALGNIIFDINEVLVVTGC